MNKSPNQTVLLLALGSSLAAGCAVAGCGSPRRGLPVAEPIDFADADLAHGRRVFMNHCNQCHPGGTAGLAPAINNKPLPGWAMRAQVRQGLGSMPAFSAAIVSDEELDDLIAYLNYLQARQPPEFARKEHR